ncbi:MAG: hypothetical protein V4650_00630 [Pseudomonadota bacterium]
MQMRPDVQIQSMLKALNDVVLPALDPANKLAQEQARLVMGMLALMSQQLPLQFRFDCDELTRLIGFCRELEAAAGVEATTLSGRAAAASAVLARAKADPAEVQQAVKQLRAVTSEVVARAFSVSDTALQDRVQRLVLALAAEQNPRDRAWFAAQNWEPDPRALQPIETLLRPVGSD